MMDDSQQDIAQRKSILERQIGFKWALGEGRYVNDPVNEREFETSMPLDTANALVSLLNRNPNLGNHALQEVLSGQEEIGLNLELKAIAQSLNKKAPSYILDPNDDSKAIVKIPFELVTEDNFKSYQPDLVAEQIERMIPQQKLQKLQMGAIVPSTLNFAQMLPVLNAFDNGHYVWNWEDKTQRFVSQVSAEDAAAIRSVVDKNQTLNKCGINLVPQSNEPDASVNFYIPFAATQVNGFWSNLQHLTGQSIEIEKVKLKPRVTPKEVDPEVARVEARLRWDPEAEDPIDDIEARWRELSSSKGGATEPSQERPAPRADILKKPPAGFIPGNSGTNRGDGGPTKG